MNKQENILNVNYLFFCSDSGVVSCVNIVNAKFILEYTNIQSLPNRQKPYLHHKDYTQLCFRK